MIFSFEKTGLKEDFKQQGIEKDDAFELLKNDCIDLLSKEMKKQCLIKFEEKHLNETSFNDEKYSVRGRVCVLRIEQVEYINHLLSCLDMVGGERIRRTIMDEITNK